MRASGAQAPTLRGAPFVCRSEAVPGFLPGDCARAPRERRQCPATNLTPGALSRGLGSSHRCRLASGPALCRQAPVLRWPTQASSASEVAPLRATRKVWCISRWAFKHGAAAGPRVPPVALPSRTLRKRPGVSSCRGTGPERLSISTETFFPGGISVWRRARALPRDPGLDLVEGAWWFSREPLGRTSLLSLQDSTSTMKLQAVSVVLQKYSVFQREGCDSSAWAGVQSATDQRRVGGTGPPQFSGADQLPVFAGPSAKSE